MADETPTGEGSKAPDADKSKDDAAKHPWGDNFDPQRIWDTMLTQRASEEAAKTEAAKAAKERDDLKKELDDAKRTTMSDDERKTAESKEIVDERDKLRVEVGTLKVTLAETTIRYEIMLAATKGEFGEGKARFRNPAIAIRMIDRSDLALDTATGLPKAGEVDRVLNELVKENPYLLDDGKSDDEDSPAPKSKNGRVPPVNKDTGKDELTKAEIEKRRERSRRQMRSLIR